MRRYSRESQVARPPYPEDRMVLPLVPCRGSDPRWGSCPGRRAVSAGSTLVRHKKALFVYREQIAEPGRADIRKVRNPRERSFPLPRAAAYSVIAKQEHRIAGMRCPVFILDVIDFWMNLVKHVRILSRVPCFVKRKTCRSPQFVVGFLESRRLEQKDKDNAHAAQYPDGSESVLKPEGTLAIPLDGGGNECV